MSKQEVLSILENYGLSATRSLGQNFLCNDAVIDEILDLAKITKSKQVLEIGPGIGALSEKAASSAAAYTAVEIDQTFTTRLHDLLDPLGGEVIFQDYLKWDADSLSGEKRNPDVILSNLPYYVMTPIMVKLMQDFPLCPKMVFMVEEEACDRIFAMPCSKQYGPLAILTDLFGRKEKCFNVDGGSFYPAPNTTSSVIRIERSLSNEDGQSNPHVSCFREAEWFSMVTGAFALRRKTLVNSLSSGGKYSKNQILSALSEMGQRETVRSEDLLPMDFVVLYQILRGRKGE